MASNFDGYDRSILVANMGTMFLYTENSGNTSTLYSFSYAGGQSTWSFGVIQADVGHNGQAQSFLQTIGFNQSQIAELSQQGQISASELANLNQILASHEGAVDQFMAAQMDQKINRLDQLINILKDANPSAAQSILNDKDLQLRLLDFDNQFNISGLGGSAASQNGMLRYLEGYPVTLGSGAVLQLPAGAGLSVNDIKNYIGNTTQAIQNPNDIQRRSSDLDKALKEIHSAANSDSGGDGQSVSDSIDQNGNTVSTVTDGDRTTVSIYDPNGVLLQTTIDYQDGGDHVSKTTNYDNNGGISGSSVTRTDKDGNSKTSNYDANGALTSDSWKDDNGASGADVYNSDGTSSGSQLNADGSSSTYQDDGHGDRTTTNYDAHGDVTSVKTVATQIDDQGGVTTTTSTTNYDTTTGAETGHSVQSNDGHGNTTTSDYDANGNLTSYSWQTEG